ncbi:hypothetical protein [Polymorphospora sp. NPDC050346]|uniref:hypothetical protein n=1 Tax=Polymorphospora sp. NPDC050346 TaxID=3155780 RepID=UPI003400E9ED
MTGASIDDLLQHEEEPPPRLRRDRSGLRLWLRTVAIAAACTAVTLFGLRLFGFAVPMVAVFAGFLALLVLRQVTARLAPPAPVRPLLREDDGAYNWSAQDALQTAVGRWETVLARAQNDPERFNQVVLPALGELVDERLRQRHGFTRATDPERARALLTDPLWKLLTTPARRKPRPADIAAAVAQLEKT